MTRRKRPTAADEVRAIISGGMGAVDAVTRTWGGSRPGAGRKPTGQPVRETRIMVRVTEEEFAEFERAAGDVPVSTWMRATCLREARRKR